MFVETLSVLEIEHETSEVEFQSRSLQRPGRIGKRRNQAVARLQRAQQAGSGKYPARIARLIDFRRDPLHGQQILLLSGTRRPVNHNVGYPGRGDLAKRLEWILDVLHHTRQQNEVRHSIGQDFLDRCMKPERGRFERTPELDEVGLFHHVPDYAGGQPECEILTIQPPECAAEIQYLQLTAPSAGDACECGHNGKGKLNRVEQNAVTLIRSFAASYLAFSLVYTTHDFFILVAAGRGLRIPPRPEPPFKTNTLAGGLPDHTQGYWRKDFFKGSAKIHGFEDFVSNALVMRSSARFTGEGL